MNSPARGERSQVLEPMVVDDGGQGSSVQALKVGFTSALRLHRLLRDSCIHNLGRAVSDGRYKTSIKLINYDCCLSQSTQIIRRDMSWKSGYYGIGDAQPHGCWFSEYRPTVTRYGAAHTYLPCSRVAHNRVHCKMMVACRLFDSSSLESPSWMDRFQIVCKFH